jgi:hypothetical protein
VITTAVPGLPLGGVRDAIVGPITNEPAGAATPPTVTTTGPDVIPAGTIAVMEVLLHEVVSADMPLKVTMFSPCDTPNPVPAIVTGVPVGPAVGISDDACGMTVKLMPLLGPAADVTITGPEVAFVGTGTTMLESVQLLGDAGTPLNVIVPGLAPNAWPDMVTAVPTAPEVGDSEVMRVDSTSGVITVES